MSDKRRNPQPLDAAGLEALALAYVARFATTQAKLAAYLRRKLRERDWQGDTPPAVDALVRRHADAGHVDDAAWARMKAGSLMRRGYGARRIGDALGQAGIEEELRMDARPSPRQQRRAALVLAERRRLGPFAPAPPDRPMRERQIAAMLRAGHPLDIARRIVDARDAEGLRAWAASPAGEDAGDEECD